MRIAALVATSALLCGASLRAVAAPREAGSFKVTATLNGKRIVVNKVSVIQDGEVYLHVAGKDRRGFALKMSPSVSEGKPIVGQSITAHVPLKGGKIENLIGKGKFTVTFKSFKLGTWKKPGKCSGKLSATATGLFALSAKGTFRDVECSR